MRTIVLGIGNDLLGEDAAGVLAARLLRHRLGRHIDIEETAVTGAALMECMIGYDQAILLDAVLGSGAPPGTILELQPSDLSRVANPSPHYAGIPEMIDLADQFGFRFPRSIRIMAVEVTDNLTIGAPISRQVESGIQELASRVASMLEGT